MYVFHVSKILPATSRGHWKEIKLKDSLFNLIFKLFSSEITYFSRVKNNSSIYQFSIRKLNFFVRQAQNLKKKKSPTCFGLFKAFTENLTFAYTVILYFRILSYSTLILHLRVLTYLLEVQTWQKPKSKISKTFLIVNRTCWVKLVM